ncbi:MAG TPA: hypothetical protein VGB07_15525 [Blastocatellia bacterium]
MTKKTISFGLIGVAFFTILFAGKQGSPLNIEPTVGAASQDKGNRLSVGEQLGVGQSLKSNNGAYTLVLQTDGNLVLYKTGGSHTWAAFPKPGGTKLILQGDGNLVLYASDNRVMWSSGSNVCKGASFLVLQDDGNLVIYNSDNRAIWSKDGIQRGCYNILRGSEETKIISGGYMRTSFTLSRSGNLTVQTRSWTNNELQGFHGNVTIMICTPDFDCVITKSVGCGVAGKLDPSGKSDRNCDWQQDIPSEIAATADSFVIKHERDKVPFWDNPQVKRFFDQAGRLYRENQKEAKEAIGPIMKALSGS